MQCTINNRFNTMFYKLLSIILMCLLFSGCSKVNHETNHENKNTTQQDTKTLEIGKKKNTNLVRSSINNNTPEIIPNSVPIYSRLPSFTLTNQRNENITNDNFYGRVWIANFMFTRCKNACAAQTARMLDLQNSLKQSNRWNDVRLASFTSDSEFDTPSILSNYLKEKNIESSQWHLLTGTKQQLDNLRTQGFKLPTSDN